MTIRAELCYRLSLSALDQPVSAAAAERADYQQWRLDALSHSWGRFDDALVNGKRVLDFGCGAGQLSLFLASTRTPAAMTGVDVDWDALARARTALELQQPELQAPCSFVEGSPEGLPFADQTFDTILAFDCFEHVMEPAAILAEFARVLAPGGRVAIEWFPFRGPWGPHMESLVPIPWAHALFGERAMFAAAARLYDHPKFQPRHWDMDELGNKRPNKWRQWTSFHQQAYVNELTMAEFKRLVATVGFEFARFELFGIGGAKGPLSVFGKAVARIPQVGEWLTSYCLVELQKRQAGN